MAGSSTLGPFPGKTGHLLKVVTMTRDEEAKELLALVTARAVATVIESQKATLQRFGCSKLVDNFHYEHELYLDRESIRSDEDVLNIRGGWLSKDETEAFLESLKTRGGYSSKTISKIIDVNDPFWQLLNLVYYYFEKSGAAPLCILDIMRHIDTIDIPITEIIRAILREYPPSTLKDVKDD